VYGSKWYFRFGAYEFVGASFIIGCLYYFLVQRHKGDQVLDEHRAEIAEFSSERVHLGEMAP